MKKSLVFLFLLSNVLIYTNIYSQVVLVSPDYKDKGVVIPSEFIGIAYEISEVTPDPKIPYYFAPHNSNLIQMIKTLGIKTIRIGGNTADLVAFRFPTKADIDSLFQFAQKANVKVNYTFRLKDGQIVATESLAKYIYTHYRKNLSCFAIGNEPDLFEDINYDSYSNKWKNFYRAIRKACHGVKFCGPNIAGKYPEWMLKFFNEYGKNGDISLLAAHTYPGNSGSAVRNTDSAIHAMLSTEWFKVYKGYTDRILLPIKNSGIPFQLEEVNSFYNGGAKHVSDTFTSALWILDYMYWLALHEIEGVNFQNGDSVAHGRVLTPCKYAAFVTTANGYFARPSSYGIKAFELGAMGRLVKTQIEHLDRHSVLNEKTSSKKDSLNLVAYTALNGQSVSITIINKEHFEGGQSAKIRIPQAPSLKHAEIIWLKAPNDDVRQESGIRLGDSSIKEDGSWHGKWQKIEIDPKHFINLDLQKASAVIVKMY